MTVLGTLLLLGLAVVSQAWHPLVRHQRTLTETCSQGSFASLKPFITASPVLDLEWVGADDQTVFAITHKRGSESGGLWRSRDGGTSFISLTAKLNASTNSGDAFAILGVFAQKSSPGNVLLLGQGGNFWLSNDYGDNFTPMPLAGGWKGRSIASLKFHPWRDDWLLMLVQRPSCGSLDKARGECPLDLMLNQNVFNPTTSQWRNLTTESKGKVAGFVDFDWGANLCPSKQCNITKDIHEQLIMATAYARPGDYDQPWDKDVNFVVSSDFFKDEVTTRVHCGNQFEVVGRSVYLAVANSCPVGLDGKSRSGSSYPQGITLYTSMDAGKTFTQACLPVAIDRQEGYELVETHDNAGAVVVVDFTFRSGIGESMLASSVYTAGPHQALFSLSLTNVYSPMMGATSDFTRVEGVPGVYIANQLLPWAPGEGQGSDQFPDPDTAYYDSYYEEYSFGLDPLVETRITFNGGGRWQRIPAPKQYNDPACDRCMGQSPCYLHLHGLSDWEDYPYSLPAVYSNPSAPGMIMATGNVAQLGYGLEKDKLSLCTWLSTDGGLTWSDVGVGAYIYEFADWGGVLVTARHPGLKGTGAGAAADEVRFSLDYGKCWKSVPLAVPLLVDNIRIEPDGQRAKVIVHGRACANTTDPKCIGGTAEYQGAVPITAGLMYTVDVPQLLGKEELCGAASYEMWTVPGSANASAPRCALGSETQIQRRRSDAACFQGPKYNRTISTKPCNCTKEQDTECDYGYVRQNGTCVDIPSDQMPQCPVIDSGRYKVSKSKRRLVQGDKCLNPWAIIPDTGGSGQTASKGGRSSSSGGGWVVGLVVGLVLLVLLGLALGWYQFRASEEQKETVRELAGSAAANVGAMCGLLGEKISGLFSRLRGRHHSASATGEELGYFQPLGDPGYDPEGRGNIFTLK